MKGLVERSKSISKYHRAAGRVNEMTMQPFERPGRTLAVRKNYKRVSENLKKDRINKDLSSLLRAFYICDMQGTSKRKINQEKIQSIFDVVGIELSPYQREELVMLMNNDSLKMAETIARVLKWVRQNYFIYKERSFKMKGGQARKKRSE